MSVAVHLGCHRYLPSCGVAPGTPYAHGPPRLCSVCMQADLLHPHVTRFHTLLADERLRKLTSAACARCRTR